MRIQRQQRLLSNAAQLEVKIKSIKVEVLFNELCCFFRELLASKDEQDVVAETEEWLVLTTLTETLTETFGSTIDICFFCTSA